MLLLLFKNCCNCLGTSAFKKPLIPGHSHLSSAVNYNIVGNFSACS